MRILNFIASLLPSFKRESVIEDMRLTRAELVEHTLPAYATAVSLLKNWKFKSKILEKQLDIFGRMVKGKGNPITVINDSFKDILENLDYVESVIDKTFNEEIAGSGLTYKATNLVQMSEAFAFTSKFARKFLIYVYVCETASYDETDSGLADSITPAEIQWIDANFISFCTAFNVVSGKPQQVQKQLSEIPDIIVTKDNEHTLAATMGESKIDPFQMNLIPIWMNPIYHVGMFVAEWQADRYKAAKEEVKLLQLRKLNLEKVSEGKPDAHIQKEITYMESRIQGINYKLQKMETANA